MEHQKHSSEYIDSLIDNIYWNWKYIGDNEDCEMDEHYIIHRYRAINVWVVVTLKNGYKLGDSMTGDYSDMFDMVYDLYYELKRKFMYTLDYISYMQLHKGITLIKNDELERLKWTKAQALYKLSLKEGKITNNYG